MKEREKKELINLLNNFSKNLDCYWDCGNCEYGILRGYGDNFSCPLNLVENMVDTILHEPELWEKLHG